MSQLAPGETEDYSLDLKLVMALLRQLRKADVLNAGMIQAVRNDFLSDYAFYEGNSTQEDYAELLVMLEAFDEQALGVGSSAFRAAQKRKALREYNTRSAKFPGGKGD